MNKLLFSLFGIYLISTLLYNLNKKCKFNSITEWVPIEYWKEFIGCNESISMFDKGEEIPTDGPTLFIVGNVLTKNKGVLFMDRLASFLTFGWIRFNEIIPVREPLTLRLYLKNISVHNFSVQGGITDFYIKYPSESNHSRTWRIDIPNLPNPGDCRFVNSEKFFYPEVPGTHEIGIIGHPGLVYAAPYGVGDRKYRITSPGAPWLFRFHVSSGYEYRVFIVAFVALAVAIFSLIMKI